jgi:hypothetical protein
MWHMQERHWKSALNLVEENYKNRTRAYGLVLLQDKRQQHQKQ